jgi:hypothetical protein
MGIVPSVRFVGCTPKESPRSECQVQGALGAAIFHGARGTHRPKEAPKTKLGRDVLVTFQLSSRDDLLATSEEVILAVGIKVNQTNQAQCYKMVCYHIREVLTSKCGVDRDEEVLMQAWDGEEKVWGELAPLLKKTINNDWSTWRCRIHTRICRSELQHLFTDNTPPKVTFRG